MSCRQLRAFWLWHLDDERFVINNNFLTGFFITIKLLLQPTRTDIARLNILFFIQQYRIKQFFTFRKDTYQAFHVRKIEYAKDATLLFHLKK